MIIQIGNKVYKQFLHTIEDIGKGLSFITQKLIGLYKDIKFWLGFIFNWDDIKKTHLSIEALTKNTLETTPKYIGKFRGQADERFKTVDEMTKNWEDNKEELKNQKSKVPGQLPNADKGDIVNSAKFNWVFDLVSSDAHE